MRAQHLAQLTTMQPEVYIKIKVARKVLIGIQYKNEYENVIKGDRKCSYYTFLPQSAPTTQSVPRKVAPGTPPTDQRLLTIATPNKSSTYTYMQIKENSKKQYNNT